MPRPLIYPESCRDILVRLKPGESITKDTSRVSYTSMRSTACILKLRYGVKYITEKYGNLIRVKRII